MLNEVHPESRDREGRGASTRIYWCCPSPPPARQIHGASAPPHPANPSLAKVGTGGRQPGDARARAAAPGAALLRPPGRLSGPGRDREEGGYSPGGGWRPQSAESGAGRRRLSAAPGRAPSPRQLLGPCPLRSPRASLAAPGPRRSAGGCPGNGREPVASAAAPVYYCDSSYFLFGGLEERKRICRVGAGGGGRRRVRERRFGGDEGGPRLSPASWRSRGCQTCHLGEGRSFLQRYFGVSGRTEGSVTHATQWWGRGWGAETASSQSRRAHSLASSLLCKTAAELSSRPGRLEFSVLLSLFLPRSAFRSSPGVLARKGSALLPSKDHERMVVGHCECLSDGIGVFVFVGGDAKQVSDFGGKLTFYDRLPFPCPLPFSFALSRHQSLRPQSGNTGSSRWDNR